MSRPGPAPKPTALKVLEGFPGHHPPNLYEPKPLPVAPRCPSWLLPEAKREWKRVAPELERLGLLTCIDGAVLAAYCMAYAKWRGAEEALAKEGSTMTTQTGYLAPRPEVAIARSMLIAIRQYAAEFGLSPSSRGRMSIPDVPSDEDSPFDI